MAVRRYDIDWLRSIAILAVFFFHCCMFFTPVPWHLKNPQKSDLAMVIVVFLDAWIMPLFFLMAGFSTRFALKRRTTTQYIKERFLRLLLPLYTVGALILLPPQFYWDSLTKGTYSGSFLSFYPQYFTHINLSPTPFFLSFWSGHLWFLKFLFLISLAALPLLLFFKTPAGERFLSTLDTLSAKTYGPVLLFLPIFLCAVLTRPIPGQHSWASFAGYLLFFLLGVVFASGEGFSRMLSKWRFIFLALGAGAFALVLSMFMAKWFDPFNPDQPLLLLTTGHAVIIINRILWIAAILGFAAKHLQFNNNALAYCSEAVLPFYILHQTIILWTGSYIIPLNMGIPAKFALIALLSFAGIMLIYETAVRRFNIVRFFFGMRPKQ